MQPFAPDIARETRTALGAIAAQGESERYWRINRYEGAFDGLDVDGRPSFWDTSVPLRERAPVVRAQLPRVAARRLTALLFSDRAFPKVRVRDAAFARVLTDEDRTKLSALVTEIIATAKIPAVMRATTMAGLRSGTVVAVTGIRAGRPVVDFLPAKCCTPTFDDEGRLTRVEYLQKVPAPGGRWMLHRRVIDATRDVSFKPVDVAELKEGTDLDALPVAGPPRALSFLPVVWIRNQPDPSTREVDGYPIHHGLLAEIDAADMECSQLHRTALYNGEPVMVRIGGKPDAPLGPEGRAAAPTAAEQQHGGAAWGTALPSFVRNALSAFRGSGNGAVKKSPNTVWNAPDGGDVKLVESTGAGQQILSNALATHTRVVTDAMGVVLAQPSDLGGNALSSKALSILFAPMLATADELRVTYGDALVEIVNQLLRWCYVTAQGIYLASLDPARVALASLSRDVDGGGFAWMGAPIELAWGEYFEPTWQDIRDAVAAAREATGGAAVLAPARALRFIAPVLGIEDTEEAVRDLDSSRVADVGAMRDTLASLGDDALDAAPQVEAVQDTALNGAQVDSMVTLAKEVAAGALPLDTAAAIMVRAFQMSPEAARALLAPAARMHAEKSSAVAPVPVTAPVEPPPAGE